MIMRGFLEETSGLTLNQRPFTLFISFDVRYFSASTKT